MLWSLDRFLQWMGTLCTKNPNQFTTCFMFSLIKKNFSKYCVKIFATKTATIFQNFCNCTFCKTFCTSDHVKIHHSSKLCRQQCEVCTFFKNIFSFIKMSLLNITHQDFENSVAKISFTNRFFEFLGEKENLFLLMPLKNFWCPSAVS